jgi:hypothetical protein
MLFLERWRSVVGFPNYEVSSLGRVRSRRNQTALKPGLSGKGQSKYLCVSLSGSGGRPRTRLIHQLVLEAFAGPRPKDSVARHLDGNRMNCRVENLVWGSRKENMADRRVHGRGNNGERNPRAKLNSAQVLEIRATALTKFSIAQLATKYGVSRTTIHNIRTGRRW